MPYEVIKIVEGVWAIKNKQTGKIVGYSDTKEKAEASVRARMAGEYGNRQNK